MNGKAVVLSGDSVVLTEMHMKAAVLYGKEDLQIESVAVPSIGEGDVLVRVQAALTCGTDVKVFRRGYHARNATSAIHDLDPAIVGFEEAEERKGAGTSTSHQGHERSPATTGSVKAITIRRMPTVGLLIRFSEPTTPAGDISFLSPAAPSGFVHEVIGRKFKAVRL